MAAGLTNLANGLVYLGKQVLGAWIAATLTSALLVVPLTRAAEAVGAGWLWVFVPLLILGLAVAFQTGRGNFLWACLGGALGYAGLLVGDELTVNLGTLTGTVIAVVFAALWVHRTGRPASVVSLPALIILVSGSIGFAGWPQRSPRPGDRRSAAVPADVRRRLDDRSGLADRRHPRQASVRRDLTPGKGATTRAATGPERPHRRSQR